MMTAPPRAAVWLLEVALPAVDGEPIVGDLCEEFELHVAPARGATLARWWFCRQVVRSLAPLIIRAWQRASIERAASALAVAALASTIPAAALLALRTFVLQQVPLKTTAELSPEFGVALLVVVLTATAAGLAAAIRLLRASPRR